MLRNYPFRHFCHHGGQGNGPVGGEQLRVFPGFGDGDDNLVLPCPGDLPFFQVAVIWSGEGSPYSRGLGASWPGAFPNLRSLRALQISAVVTGHPCTVAPYADNRREATTWQSTCTPISITKAEINGEGSFQHAALPVEDEEEEYRLLGIKIPSRYMLRELIGRKTTFTIEIS